MKKIFIGGYRGSGSRVVQHVLQHAGYYIGEVNGQMDFEGVEFVRCFNSF